MWLRAATERDFKVRYDVGPKKQKGLDACELHASDSDSQSGLVSGEDSGSSQRPSRYPRNISAAISAPPKHGTGPMEARKTTNDDDTPIVSACEGA